MNTIENSTIEELEQAETVSEHSEEDSQEEHFVAHPKRFEEISGSDERAIEQFNRLVDEEMAHGLIWIPGPFAVDFWSGRRTKPKPNKCMCQHCGYKHNLKGG